VFVSLYVFISENIYLIDLSVSACSYMLSELKKREGFEMVVDQVSYNYSCFPVVNISILKQETER